MYSTSRFPLGPLEFQIGDDDTANHLDVWLTVGMECLDKLGNEKRITPLLQLLEKAYVSNNHCWGSAHARGTVDEDLVLV